MGLILSIYMIFDKEKIGLGCKKILYATVSRTKADEMCIRDSYCSVFFVFIRI